MEKLIFNCIKIYKEFYSNPDLLVQDTTSEMNKYPDMLYSLNKCCVIIDKIENCKNSDFVYEIGEVVIENNHKAVEIIVKDNEKSREE